ncbi:MULTISPECIES: hypothetical protein [unclassified Psychrobacter]|uniref:hypothetical protein n=1 Tax=unclassified Psychrobacter TaxID=196806 RepID=UPI0018F4E58C|nr:MULTISPECIES: hypothetical protein [unclassified Psychrobacter]
MRREQITLFMIDVIAYCIAGNGIGQTVLQISKEVEKLQLTELLIKSTTKPSPLDERAPIRGNSNPNELRRILEGAKDPRYVRNPLYKLKKHSRANGHHLFDKLTMPERVGKHPKKPM